MRPPMFEQLPQVGGHPALNLINTVEYRGRTEPKDRLITIDRLLSWCEIAGVIDGQESSDLRNLLQTDREAGQAALQEVRNLREAARKALGAMMNGTVDATALELLRARIERAARAVRVTIDDSGSKFTRREDAAGFNILVDRIALLIEAAFAIAGRERLRECEGSNCDWLFFDRSRSGVRRWCHPGQCGNAERVRNFRARRTGKSKRS